FVLTTNGGASPISGYSEGKRRLGALLPADMPAWRLHDLRRTCASGFARLCVHPPVLGKDFDHPSWSFSGMVGICQKNSFAAEKAQALEAWGNFVAALVEGKPARVIRLRRMRS